MTTIATVCTGFDGVGVGARAAGLELAWGIELEPAIAEVANANLGKHVTVANLLDCDPSKFEATNVLHASPPCTNASQANANGGETALDMALGRKIAEFVTVLKPRIFTLENVWQYRRFRAWHHIEEALHKMGYWVSVEHCNAAEYGVPQTRKRMIVRAVRGGFVPYLPESIRWVGWYAAIEDLLDTLPESQFAPWQLARLPELLATTLVGSGGFDGRVAMAHEREPSFTVTANENQLVMRAFLVSNAKTEYGDGLRFDNEPAGTVTAQSNGRLRAFLVGDQEGQLAMPNDPAFTVRAGEHGGGNTNFGEAYPGRGCRYPSEPSHTVTTVTEGGGAMPKAWLVDGQNASETDRLTIRDDGKPSFTITNQSKGYARALFESGHVVAMTPRALARFQSFPDWYQLPDNARLAAKGIGNAVCPLLYQRIIESLITSS